MIVKLKSPNVVLKTKDRYCTEDIHITLDDSLVNGEVSTLKTLLDTTKSASYLFEKYQGESVEGLIGYSDTENVTDMSYMFNECRKLKTQPYINTSNTTDMSCMFAYNKELQTVQIDTSKVTTMSLMFNSCDRLKKVDISYYNFSSTSSTSLMFQMCHRLKIFIIRSFGKNYTLDNLAFNYDYKMLGQVHATYNPNGEQGYIYCPRDMIETLQNATNWSVLQFRALEDYTLDGTCEGEFDDEKAGIYYD